MFAVNGILKASRIDYFCCKACRLIEATYMTSLGCLCPEPASFEIFRCKHVCVYVCISPHLPQFQVRPLKLRLFHLQSIYSERKQKNTQKTNEV